MPLQDLRSVSKVIGTKQVKKAIAKKQVKKVYIASDAEPHIIRPIQEACEENQIEYEMVESMEMLGRVSGIDVGSAAVAILND